MDTVVVVVTKVSLSAYSPHVTPAEQSQHLAPRSVRPTRGVLCPPVLAAAPASPSAPQPILSRPRLVCSPRPPSSCPLPCRSLSPCSQVPPPPPAALYFEPEFKAPRVAPLTPSLLATPAALHPVALDVLSPARVVPLLWTAGGHRRDSLYPSGP